MTGFIPAVTHRNVALMHAHDSNKPHAYFRTAWNKADGGDDGNNNSMELSLS
jgi:hypothetical protein